MIVYHGSNVAVENPDLTHSRAKVDFGAGFYVTPIREQAVKWSERFARIGEDGVVSRYALDETAFEKLRILRFETYSEQWLDFILICRKGLDKSDYDAVCGGVANDRVFNTVELYFDGLIDKSEAIKRLRYEAPNMQIALRSPRALECLRFEGSDKL